MAHPTVILLLDEPRLVGSGFAVDALQDIGQKILGDEVCIGVRPGL
jgi:hypothetical protein